MKRFSYLVLAAAIAVWLLVVVGGIVRVTGSGMGCGPDWPLCNGRVIPQFDLPTLIEFVHRLAAAGGSLLVVAAFIAAWRLVQIPAWIRWSVLAAGAVLIVQILLGAITVKLELAPVVVSLHLGVAALLLGLLTIASSAMLSGQRVRAALDGFAKLTIATAIATYALILIGSYMMGSGASLGCTSFPLCDGGQVLPIQRPAGLTHMVHRLAAVSVGGLIAAAIVQARRQRATDQPLNVVANLAGLIYGGQFLVGVGNVLFYLPSALRVAHLGLAFALWVAVVALATLASTRRAVIRRAEDEELMRRSHEQAPFSLEPTGGRLHSRP